MNPGENENTPVPGTPATGEAPGGERGIGPIPRGVEELLKKAAVDPRFAVKILEQRAAAAKLAGVELDPPEQAMLAAVSHEQLLRMILHTTMAEARQKKARDPQAQDRKRTWKEMQSQKLTGIRVDRPQ